MDKGLETMVNRILELKLSPGCVCTQEKGEWLEMFQLNTRKEFPAVRGDTEAAGSSTDGGKAGFQSQVNLSLYSGTLLGKLHSLLP